MPVGEINQNLIMKFVGKTVNGITYGASQSAPKRILFVKRDFSSVLSACASSTGSGVRIYDLPSTAAGMPLTGGVWTPENMSVLPGANNIGGITYLNSFDISNNTVNIDNVISINGIKYFSRFQRVVLNSDPAQGLRLIVERSCSRTDTTIVGVLENINLRYVFPSQNNISVPITIKLQRNF